MTSPITLDALRTLDAIARRQSFAAAAEERFRVPSAVSYTVSKLEEELGVTLFDRSGRRATLTPVGQLVLDEGRALLAAADALAARARQAADGWETQLRIAVDTVLTTESLAPLLAEFSTQHPGTELRLSEESLGGSWDALLSGRCDLVIGASDEAPVGGLAVSRLGQARFVFAISPSHPLAGQPTPWSAEVLAAWPGVVVADSTVGLPARTVGLLDGRRRIVVASMRDKIALQRAGLGIGFLPRHRIGAALAEGVLVMGETEFPVREHALSVAWRRDAPGKALAWFVKRLRAWRFDAELGLISPATGG